MSDYGADMAALCSTDGEQSLLGVMMFDPRAWPSIEGRVHAGQFRSEVHGRLFKHAATLLKAGPHIELFSSDDAATYGQTVSLFDGGEE